MAFESQNCIFETFEADGSLLPTGCFFLSSRTGSFDESDETIRKPSSIPED